MPINGIEPVLAEVPKFNGIGGQIAGALLRFSGLPPVVVQLLPASASIVDTASRFAVAVVESSIRIEDENPNP
jgi:hypothetical protein